MPDWISQLLTRFFTDYGYSIDRNSLQYQYLTIEDFNRGRLELNYLPEGETLLFSMCLEDWVDNLLMEKALLFNHFSRLRPLFPSLHMFEDKLVFRSSLSKHEISIVNLENMLTCIKQAQFELVEG
ncbi:hypothetical protein TDB9533_04600 [Thalassocella blandensis]|nr:hypothetical protein TDB9533_04600 [Thalassocella blandensis]